MNLSPATEKYLSASSRDLKRLALDVGLNLEITSDAMTLWEGEEIIVETASTSFIRNFLALRDPEVNAELDAHFGTTAEIKASWKARSEKMRAALRASR